MLGRHVTVQGRVIGVIGVVAGVHGGIKTRWWRLRGGRLPAHPFGTFRCPAAPQRSNVWMELEGTLAATALHLMIKPCLLDLYLVLSLLYIHTIYLLWFLPAPATNVLQKWYGGSSISVIAVLHFSFSSPWISSASSHLGSSRASAAACLQLELLQFRCALPPLQVRNLPERKRYRRCHMVSPSSCPDLLQRCYPQINFWLAKELNRKDKPKMCTYNTNGKGAIACDDCMWLHVVWKAGEISWESKRRNPLLCLCWMPSLTSLHQIKCKIRTDKDR